MNAMSSTFPHHDICEKVLEDHPHAFRPPVEGDSRCPCPALNTLANHGYLPRNGRDITTQDFVTALCSPETYNLSRPLARFLVYGGHVLLRNFKASSLSLHELARHGRIEHDASVVHKDTKAGDEFAPCVCDTELLDTLLKETPLTLDRLAQRRVMLEKLSPLDALHQEVARGEWALVFDIFGRENGGEISPAVMKAWLKENRFPEGWKPTHELGLMATVFKSFEIRRKMNEYRKIIKEGNGEHLMEADKGEVDSEHQ